jgi:hypothetical protein
MNLTTTGGFVAMLLLVGIAGQQSAVPADRLIVPQSGIGKVRLGMTLEEARRALPDARFSRTSDGDGAALIEVSIAPDQSLVLWAGEDDPGSAIGWTRKIGFIETTSPAFRTNEGVHAGMAVRAVEAVFGPVKQIVRSEIESREFLTFERQPVNLVLRLDYTGVFPAGRSSTREYQSGAKILSIAVMRDER